MTEPVWLLKPAILAVQNLLIARFGGPEGLRDGGLLDSALARPVNLHHCEDCTELPLLAASYAAGIIRNHPFVDGGPRAQCSSIDFVSNRPLLAAGGITFAQMRSP